MGADMQGVFQQAHVLVQSSKKRFKFSGDVYGAFHPRRGLVRRSNCGGLCNGCNCFGCCKPIYRFAVAHSFGSLRARPQPPPDCKSSASHVTFTALLFTLTYPCVTVKLRNVNSSS